jgi:hypothetical protein
VQDRREADLEGEREPRQERSDRTAAGDGHG